MAEEARVTRSRNLAAQARALIGLAALAFPLAAHPAAATPPACADHPCAFLDKSLSAEIRAKDLVARMTLEEKAAQMQDNAPAIARLGLPRYGWWNEVLHGLARAGHATVYPQAIGLAATWDPGLMHAVGDAIADEGRANHNLAMATSGGSDRYYGVNYWSPNINIFRDPRWGRGQETYGEDPYLAGRMAVGFVTGIQGGDPNVFKGVATPKHFAVHSGPEPLRHGFNVQPSAYDLEDTYLPAFRAAIVDAKADSLMCAYNAVDGSPMCDSPLLSERVRGAWGFKGFIVTDCDSIDDIVRGHKTEPDVAHAAAAGVKAGADLDCGRSYAALPEAVKQGLIREDQVDVSLERLMAARIRMGLLDGSAYDAIPPSDLNSLAHRALALKAAREALVLLSNKGVLPLSPSTRVAVIGPNADLLQSIEGNYTGSPVDPSLPVDALKAAFGADHVVYAPGAILTEGMRQPVASTALHPVADSAEAGLKGEYYDNLDFSGAPKLVRVDPVINFDFYHTAPTPDFKPMGFSIRWSGVFVPPAPGTYKIGFRMITPLPGQPRPDVHVWVDGKLVVTPDMLSDPAEMGMPNISAACPSTMCLPAGKTQAQITFTDTAPHTVRIDYVRANEDRAISFDWIPPARPLVDGAVAAAKASDVVVAFVGLSPDLEGEEMKIDYPGFKGGDRTDMTLPAVQQQMLQAVKATGKPLVVVYMTGGEISDPWVEQNADAVVQAWYPGEAGGQAIADVLLGKANPSGRLPYTIYRSVDDLPAFTDYAMKGRTYRYFTGPVLHAFGDGRSYTRFAYAHPRLSAKTVAAGQTVTAKVQVTNTGARDGEEVVELYLAKPRTALTPRLALAGFIRLSLKAGEHGEASLRLDPRALSQVDAAGVRRVLPGTYTVYMGGAQPGRGPGVVARLTVTGSVTLPK